MFEVMSMRNLGMTLRTVIKIFTFFAFVSYTNNWTDITPITEYVVMPGLWLRQIYSDLLNWFFIQFCFGGLRSKIFNYLLTLNLYSLFDHLTHGYFFCVFIRLYFLLFWLFNFLLLFVCFLLQFCFFLKNFCGRKFRILLIKFVRIRI